MTPSLTHDEMIYAANAEALSRFGTDLSGKHSWFSLIPFHHMYAEWTASLMAPFFWLIDDPIAATHALPLLISLTLPFLFGWLTYGIFKDKTLAICATILVAFSPLVIQFSKLSYDSFVALFFYLLAGALYFHRPDSRLVRAIVAVILTIGFFNYQGFKLLLLPWSIFLTLTASGRKKYDLIMYALTLTVVYGFILLPKQAAVSRLTQTIFSDQPKIEAVLFERNLHSLMPQVGRFFNNQITASLQLATNNLLGSLNPAMLFASGEPATSGFVIYSHGFFYMLDIVLILIGFVNMFSTAKRTQKQWYVLGMIISALIPVVLSTISQWYLLRSLFFYLLLYLLMAWGLKALLNHRWMLMVFTAVYLLSVSNFLYHYFFIYPVQRSNAAEFHERITVEYANRAAKNGTQVIVYDDEPLYLYMSHLLHHHTLDQFDTLDQVAIDNVLYTNTCQDESQDDVIITSALFDPCQEKKRSEHAAVVSLIDSGKKYTITNDALCGVYQLPRYVRIAQLSDFKDLERSDQAFCTRFIVNQNHAL